MVWRQVSINTTSEGIERVCDALCDIGINGFEIEDRREMMDFLNSTRGSWDYLDDSLAGSDPGQATVKVYVSATPSGSDTLEQIKRVLAGLKSADPCGLLGSLEVACSDLREEDWANCWKKYYHTTAVGKRILIRPEWEEPPADTERTVFTIDPGMSFGTGTHETTKLCLEAGERYVRPGCRVLDLGCGSGILSIVALLLGAGSATAVDIDPNATAAALKNAALNGIPDGRYTILSGDIGQADVRDKVGLELYDIVFANIVADVIVALSAHMARMLRPGGVLIASGIIGERAGQTRESLERAGLEPIETLSENGWVCMVCRRPA